MATRSTSSFRATGDGLQRLAALGKQLGGRPAVKLGVFAADAERPGVTKTKTRTITTRTPGEGVTRQRQIVSVNHGVGASEITNVQLGIIHEFGTKDGRVPERSWLRGTFDVMRTKWQQLLENLLRLVVAGKLDVVRALELVGQQASADIRRRIRSGAGIPPPLKQGTIDAKGSSRPLLHTAQFVNSISYQVEGRST